MLRFVYLPWESKPAHNYRDRLFTPCNLKMYIVGKKIGYCHILFLIFSIFQLWLIRKDHFTEYLPKEAFLILDLLVFTDFFQNIDQNIIDYIFVLICYDFTVLGFVLRIIFSFYTFKQWRAPKTAEKPFYEEKWGYFELT